MDLSIIIPVWNEEAKIDTDILNIDKHFNKKSINTELIIVDDGSSDKTVDVINTNFRNISLKARLIRTAHTGKGHAVRTGMLACEGKIAMFMDCGNNVPLYYLDKGIELLQALGSDIILGTRYHPQSKIIYPMVLTRRITSAIFRKMTRILLRLSDISDSQCGFKIFDGNIARDLFKGIETNGFLFDLEVILKAQARSCRLAELPLEWHCDRDSRLSITSSVIPVIKDLSRLRSI